MTDTAILVYVPDTKTFIDQFWGLYESVQHSSENRRKFSFVVMCNSAAAEKLPHDNCDYFIRETELCDEEGYQYLYNGNSYKYINSFHHFVDDEVVEHLRATYSHCLRLDVDTFVTPIAYRLGVEKNEIKVGGGGYDNSSVNLKLANTCEDLGIPFNKHLNNVGSTWFGHTEDVIQMGKYTCEYVKHLINHDSEFTKGEGEWPRWYAGVVLLYGGHLAACKCNYTITKFRLDVGTGGDELWDTCYTLHCWHSGDFFSKFEFGAGNYELKEIEKEEWQVSKLASDYAFWCAKRGQRFRRDIHVYETEEFFVPSKSVVYFQTYLLSGQKSGAYSIQNFHRLKESLNPDLYDVFLMADTSKNSVEDYKNDYGVGELLTYHNSCPNIKGLVGATDDIDFWAHPELPILSEYRQSVTKYKHYYAIEHDLFSDDWSKVFSEVSKVRASFICSHVIQLEDGSEKRSDFIDRKENEWVYWGYKDSVPYDVPLGHIGAFVRYDGRSLQVLLDKSKEYSHLFFEFAIPTILHGEGISIDTLSRIAEVGDGTLKFTIYHSKEDPKLRLGSGYVYWARQGMCDGGRMGPTT